MCSRLTVSALPRNDHPLSFNCQDGNICTVHITINFSVLPNYPRPWQKKPDIKHLWISKTIRGLQYSQGVLDVNAQEAD